LSWRAVLGVTAPDVAGWERVRAAQIGEFVRLSPLICLANVFNALALAFILWGSVPRWSLIAWAGAMLVAMVALARLTERTRASLSDDLPRGTIRGAVLMASLLGLLWALPPVLSPDRARRSSSSPSASSPLRSWRAPRSPARPRLR
jgi:hypothetical protein